MAFAQLNYKEKLGNGPYTIAEIGCFLTAFTNLLEEEFGQTIDPAALNNFFNAHGDYLRDPDGHLEDLAWGSISAYNPAIHVASVVDHGTARTAGWPATNKAIVKFYFKESNGQWTTHFCKVADFRAQTIVDSWNGKVTGVGEYGEPVAYATYVESGPQSIAPTAPANHSAPAAVNPAAPAYTIQAITPKQVKLNKQPTHEWNLNDTSWAQFSTNPVNTQPEGTVVKVVAIAHHKLGGAYYMTDTGKPAGFNVVDCEDYTPPPPSPAPKPAEPAKPANIVFTKLSEPKKLVTNKQPTHVWDLGFETDNHATSVKEVAKGETVEVYGRAQRTDHDRPAYFMSQEDFGEADQTGIPAKNIGINTVDLSEPPAPPPAEPAVHTSMGPATENEDGSFSVHVNVTPPSWQSTYQDLGQVTPFVAKKTLEIQDLAGKEPAVQLLKGQILPVAGQFIKDGVKYYRSNASVMNQVWYGVPVTALAKEHESMIAKAAEFIGAFERVLHKKK